MGNIEKTLYTTITLQKNGKLKTGSKPVKFTIVKPGESLIDDEAGAPPEVAPTPEQPVEETSDQPASDLSDVREELRRRQQEANNNN